MGYLVLEGVLISMVLWSVLPLSNTRCQSKTLSSPDFESTYTNKASLEAFAVC